MCVELGHAFPCGDGTGHLASRQTNHGKIVEEQDVHSWIWEWDNTRM